MSSTPLLKSSGDQPNGSLQKSMLFHSEAKLASSLLLTSGLGCFRSAETRVGWQFFLCLDFLPEPCLRRRRCVILNLQWHGGYPDCGLVSQQSRVKWPSAYRNAKQLRLLLKCASPHWLLYVASEGRRCLSK